MVRLGGKLAYRQAQEELGKFTHTQIGEKTIRDLAMKHGKACEEGEREEVERLERLAPQPKATPQKVLLSGDGAFVRLVGGEFLEIKNMAIGEFDTVVNNKGEERVETRKILSLIHI